MSQSGNHEADHENLLAWSSLDRALDPASRDILIGTVSTFRYARE
jgi:hypothetical protein